MAGLSGWHLVIILLIVLLLFGAPQLPKLAKSLGESMRIFRGEVRNMNEEADAAKEKRTPATPPIQDPSESASNRNDADPTSTLR